MNTIARLRAKHTNTGWHGPDGPVCDGCGSPWPCDTIAALDALEAEAEWLRAEAAKALDAQRAEIDKLQARLVAATVLIRRALIAAEIDRLLGDKEDGSE